MYGTYGLAAKSSVAPLNIFGLLMRFDQREVHIVFSEHTEWQAGKVWAWFKKIKLSSNANNKGGSSYLNSTYFEMRIIYRKNFKGLFSEKIQ